MKYLGSPILILFFVFRSLSQPFDLEAPIPFNPEIKKGQLENGLTYLIQDSKSKPGRAEIRLFVKVGSVHEENDQQGMAHFVEHMAFNGTKNFEKHEILNYFQKTGMRTGPDINATTSFNETTYTLSIPVHQVGALDTGLLILKDFINGITFKKKELEIERKILLEEWKLKGPSSIGMMLKFRPLFQNSSYRNRHPIGSQEVIKTVSRSALIEFYQKWYRPNLMAISIVGDINPKSVEKRIISVYSDIKADPIPVTKNTKIQFPQNNSVGMSMNPKGSAAEIMIITDRSSQQMATLKDFKNEIIYSMIIEIINNRYKQIQSTSNTVILQGNASFGEFLVPDLKVFMLKASVPSGKIIEGIQILVEENERIRRHGFSQEELDLGKEIISNRYENFYADKEYRSSKVLSFLLQKHFLNNYPLPGIDFQRQFASDVLGAITTEEINKLANDLIIGKKWLTIISGTDQLPKGQEVMDVIHNIKDSNISAYEETPKIETLIGEPPKPGKILYEEDIEGLENLGIKKLTLSNGLTAIIASTDYRNNEIAFESISHGGTSLYNGKDIYPAFFASKLVNASGIGPYTHEQIMHYNAGLHIRVEPYVNTYYEGIKGSCSKTGLENTFQLIHLAFTQPFIDKTAASKYLSVNKEKVTKELNNPYNHFFNEVAWLNTNNHPLTNLGNYPQDYENIDIERALDIYKERYSNAADFTFFFVGSFEISEIKPLIKTYLGSLPSTFKKENYRDLGIRLPQSLPIRKEIYSPIVKFSAVSLHFETPINDFNPEDKFLMRKFKDYLDLKLSDLLRYEMGDIYQIKTSALLKTDPWERLEIDITFPCASENAKHLSELIIEEIKRVQTDGIDESYIKKLIKSDREDHLNASKFNWSLLYSLYHPHESRGKPDFDFITNREWFTKNISSELIQGVINKINTDKFVHVILYPEDFR